MAGVGIKRVVVSEYAAGVIKAYFGWKKNGAWNRNEQICALGGRISQKSISVRAVIPMPGAGASPAHVKVNAETWLLAIWTFEDMGMKLVGCAHSHPGGLPVFFSSGDRTTHNSVHPDGVSIIINPQRGEITAYNRNGNALDASFPD
jgi:proteasome lid subunit RPN8/RPN11